MDKGFVYGAIAMLLIVVSMFALIPQQVNSINYNNNLFSETKIRLTNYEVIMQEIMFDSNWNDSNITNYFDGNSEELFSNLNDSIIFCSNKNTIKLDGNIIKTRIECDLLFKINDIIVVDGNLAKDVNFYRVI